MVASLAVAGVQHLVALDGAYALFPNAKAESPASNYQALEQACRTHGIGLTATAPMEPWPGNETQKRTALFQLAEQHTSPQDWYLVIDGDEAIRTAPPDLHTQLEQTPFDVAEVIFIERKKSGTVQRFPIPILFRAQRGIEVVGNHYTYRTRDGRFLWGNARSKRLAPRHPLHDLEVDHFTRQRERARRANARRYYRLRDAQRVEAGQCDRCTATATTTMHTNWRPVAEGLVADWTELCGIHAIDCEQENNARLLELGCPDPANVKIEHRLGPAPVA